MFRETKRLVRKLGWLTISASALFIGSPAMAEEEAQLGDYFDLTLEEMQNLEVTTGSLLAQKLSDVPATTVIVTAEQIKRRGYRSLLEVLRDLPGFQIDEFVTPEYLNNVSIRGARGNTSEKFLVLLDGKSIASPTGDFKTIHENYPVHMAKQVEIVYGPFSALYGADALSGVVNIISKRGGDIDGVEVSTAVGLYNEINTTLLAGGTFGDDYSFSLAGQYYYDKQPNMPELYPDDYTGTDSLKTGEFDTAFGPMTPTAKVSPGFQAPIRAYGLTAALESKKFRASLFHNYSQIPSATEYKPSDAVYNNNVFIAQSVSTASLTYTESFDTVQSTTSLSGGFYQMHPDSNYRNVFVGMEPGYKFAMGSSIKLEQQFALRPIDELTIVGGGGFEHLNATPKGADLASPVDTSRPFQAKLLGTDLEADFFTVAYNNASAFLQVQYFPTEAIQLTAGGRFDHNTRFGSVFNPRAGLVVHPAEGTTVKLLYGSAYLAPSPYQAYVHFGSFFSEDDGETYKSFFWHLPNPDLKPQRAQSAELSLRQAIGSSVALTASGFYSKYTDLISLEGASDADYGNRYDGKYRGWDVGFIEVTVNEGEQHMYGGSVQLEYSDKFGRDTKIKSYASLSYADGDVYDIQLKKNIELGCISPIHMRFGADLSWRNLSFSPRLTYVGTQRTLAKAPDADGNATENRQTLEGYMLLNLSIRYEEIIDQLSAFLVIENALNSRYKNNHAAAFDPTAAGRFDGVPQHPLRATLGLSYKY